MAKTGRAGARKKTSHEWKSKVVSEDVLDVDALLRDDKQQDRQNRMRAAAHLVLDVITGEGGFFAVAEGQVWVFEGTQKRLYRMKEGPYWGAEWMAYVGRRWGLLPSDRLSVGALQALEAVARVDGKRPTLQRFAFYDKAEKVLYLSRYNGTVYRLDGESISIEPNGAHVLFVDDDGGIFCEADLGAKGSGVLDLLTNLSFAEATAAGLLPPAQRKLFTAWILAQPFYELLPTRPYLVLEGMEGSGKTLAIERLQVLYQGRKSVRPPERDSADNFFVSLLKNPIGLLDNLDSRIEWLPDQLAALATGGERAKRKLYTDAEEVILRPRTLLAITTRNFASLTRPDVIDRCFFLRMDRVTDASRQRSEEMLAEVVTRRPQLYGQLLRLLNGLVGKLRRPAKARQYRHRMADFEALSYAVADLLQWPEEEIQALFKAAVVEGQEIALTEDPLYTAMGRWLAEFPNREGAYFSSNQLFELLKSYCEASMITWTYETPRGFAQRLKNILPSLENHFEIERRSDRTGIFQYSFRRRCREVPPTTSLHLNPSE